MLGFSIFLGEDFSELTYSYMKRMKAANFTGVFTSLHIPEDDSSHYLRRIQALGKAAQELELTLMVDISAQALEAIGVRLEEDVSSLKTIGITGIRMDYGIAMTTIAAVSRVMTVGLNASTLTADEVSLLEANQADFTQMELWHNYYPRPETGLAKESFRERNQWLQSKGLKVIAFVPGDETLRGPLFEGLPTLEDHRQMHPLAATLELMRESLVNQVYIGDERLSETIMTQFTRYFQEQVLEIQVTPLTVNYRELFIGSHTNRVDAARDVVRSQEARFKQLPLIVQESCLKRDRGSVTLDNNLYGRYLGELQITKKDLPADSRVNVVAKIVPRDLDLIDWIQPGQRYELYL